MNPADKVSITFAELSVVVTEKEEDADKLLGFLIPGISRTIAPLKLAEENKAVNLIWVDETTVHEVEVVAAPPSPALHPAVAAEVSEIIIPEGKITSMIPFVTTACCVVKPIEYVTPVAYATVELGVTLGDISEPAVIVIGLRVPVSTA